MKEITCEELNNLPQDSYILIDIRDEGLRAYGTIPDSVAMDIDADPEVRSFVASLDKNKVGRIVNFGSAAMLNSTYKKVKAEAEKAGVAMDDKEFHCKGEFKFFNKGRPNDADLKAAADFARQFAG